MPLNVEWSGHVGTVCLDGADESAISQSSGVESPTWFCSHLCTQELTSSSRQYLTLHALSPSCLVQQRKHSAQDNAKDVEVTSCLHRIRLG